LALVATGFFECGDVAEGAMGFSSSILRRQAFPNLFGHQLVEVKDEFAMELGVGCVFTQERSEAQSPNTKQPQYRHNDLRRS
jgi:hypothetical protein